MASVTKAPTTRQISSRGRRSAHPAPWATPDDARLLDSLPADIAKAIEPLLHQQARSDHRFRTLAPESLDQLLPA